jgi:tetratricopeptide (TPR) repeat protein
MATRNSHNEGQAANQRPAAKQTSAGSPVAPRIEPWLPLLLLALGIVVYANGLSGPFVFDDIKHIIEYSQAQQLALNINLERPMLFFSLGLNYWLGKFNPLGYKIFNLSVHLLAALTLYDLVRRTLLLPRFGDRFKESAAGLAFAVAALWVVHPLNTESVTYIIHRGESMMGLFALLTFYCTLRGAQSNDPWRSWLWYAAGVVACTLGFWSKPFMIAVPVVVLLYDRIMLGGTWQTWAIKRGAFYLLLLIPLLWAFKVNSGDALERLETPDRSTVLPSPAPAKAGAPGQPPLAAPPSDPGPNPDFESGYPRRTSVLRYARTQPEVIAHYLKLVFSPYPLCADYFWKPADTPGRIIPPALLIGGLVLATCWVLWRYPAWGFLGAAFFLLLGPSSSFIPIEDIATERRMYLPLAAVIALLVLGAWQLLGWVAQQSPVAAVAAQRQQRHRGLALLLVVLAIWSGLTVLRNFDYADDVEFCERVVQQVPYNSRARVNLARALTNKGDQSGTLQQRAAHYKLALEYLEEAEPGAPKSAYLHAQIGHILAQQAEMEGAAQAPDWEQRRAALLKKAERKFQQAVQLHDTNALFQLNLAVVHELQGSPEDLQSAVRHYRFATELPNKSWDQAATGHHGLGRVLAATHQYADAITEFEKALNIRPNWFEAEFNLASALFMADRRDAAIALSEKSLRQAEKEGNRQHAAMLRARLEQYRAQAESAGR